MDFLRILHGREAGELRVFAVVGGRVSGGGGAGDAGRRLEQPDEIFDGDDGVRGQAGAELTAKGDGQVADGLVDVIGVEAEVLVERIAGQDGERDELDLLQVAVGGRGDDGVKAVLLEVGGEALLGDAGALAAEGVLAEPGGDAEQERDEEQDSGEKPERPRLLADPSRNVGRQHHNALVEQVISLLQRLAAE